MEGSSRATPVNVLQKVGSNAGSQLHVNRQMVATFYKNVAVGRMDITCGLG